LEPCGASESGHESPELRQSSGKSSRPFTAPLVTLLDAGVCASSRGLARPSEQQEENRALKNVFRATHAMSKALAPSFAKRLGRVFKVFDKL